MIIAASQMPEQFLAGCGPVCWRAFVLFSILRQPGMSEPGRNDKKNAEPEAQKFLDECKRFEVGTAVELLRLMYEVQRNVSVLPKHPEYLRRASLTPTPESAEWKPFAAFKSHAHDNKQWLAIAVALAAIERGAGADTAGIGVLGKAWIRWTKASRKVLENVRISEKSAAAISSFNDDGSLCTVVEYLNYSAPTGQYVMHKEHNADVGSHSTRVFQIVKLAEIQKQKNRIYHAYCAAVWQRAAASPLPPLATAIAKLKVKIARNYQMIYMYTVYHLSQRLLQRRSDYAGGAVSLSGTFSGAMQPAVSYGARRCPHKQSA